MSLLGESFPLLVKAIGMTAMLAVVSFALGSALGALIALMRLSRYRVLRVAMWSFVAVFRGTPLLILVLLIYFGLPQVGLEFPPIQAAILAFSLYAAAYLSEHFRAAIIGVDKGQWEAAQSIGMSHPRLLRRIIFPQAVRLATPSVTGQFIHLVKDTSLASVITVAELTGAAERVGSSTFQYMEAFMIAAVAYLLLNTALTLGQGQLEKRMEAAYT